MTFEGETNTFNPNQSFFTQNYRNNFLGSLSLPFLVSKKKILVEKKLCEYLFGLKKRLSLPYCIFICKKKCCILCPKTCLGNVRKVKIFRIIKS